MCMEVWCGGSSVVRMSLRGVSVWCVWRFGVEGRQWSVCHFEEVSVWCVWRFGVEGRQWSVCHFEEVSVYGGLVWRVVSGPYVT